MLSSAFSALRSVTLAAPTRKMCRYQGGLVLDSRMSESTDVAREAEGEKVVRQPLKWNLRHSETEAGAGYGLFRPSTFDFSTFLKNEATDLYENKGSTLGKIENEPTEGACGQSRPIASGQL